MIWNIHAAKTNLSKLIERAEAGEEVVIARNGKPAVKLTPVDAARAAKQAPAVETEGRLPSWFGSMRGEIWMADDFDSVNEEIGRLMEEGDIFPSEDGND